jgi:hypothetical protein
MPREHIGPAWWVLQRNQKEKEFKENPNTPEAQAYFARKQEIEQVWKWRCLSSPVVGSCRPSLWCAETGCSQADDAGRASAGPQAPELLLAQPKTVRTNHAVVCDPRLAWPEGHPLCTRVASGASSTNATILSWSLNAGHTQLRFRPFEEEEQEEEEFGIAGNKAGPHDYARGVGAVCTPCAKPGIAPVLLFCCILIRLLQDSTLIKHVTCREHASTPDLSHRGLACQGPLVPLARCTCNPAHYSALAAGGGGAAAADAPPDDAAEAEAEAEELEAAADLDAEVDGFRDAGLAAPARASRLSAVWSAFCESR